ncbi:hypothetical protein CKO31_22730 [Thiohalocapsa halophila]|uniref:DUF349 domain-containing protein n=1 Tax=Thiohalocapsa halophila TaxID=69359 RepID=A0ABS1CNT9_9GAMM|nr:DUF349 domain-containing protein [Thiohalocapsa halophila]MBK1633509.1 hypothetical protein [Thiohalocapsa halophila]
MFFKQLLDKTRSRRPPDAAALIETARNAPDAAARREACRAVVQLQVLQGIADADADAGVRDLAMARFRRLLCGQDEQAPTLAERSATLAALDDETLLAQVAHEAVEPELRRSAIERLQHPEHLATCAVDDPLAANRHAAAERLHDRTALEAVQRRVGKRDKGVYRLVKERLRAMAEAEERPRRLRAAADAVCDKLERLGRYDNWSQDQALLQHLDREWAEIEAALGAELDTERRSRRERLRADFLSAYEAHAAAHAAELAAAEASAADAGRRAELIRALAEASALSDPDALSARLRELARDWEAVADGAPAKDQRAYADAEAAARARQDQLAAERKRRRSAEQLRRDAEDALAAGAFEQRRVQTCERRLKDLRAAGEVPAATIEAVEKLAARLKKHREQMRRKLASLPERLAELDAHFAAGRLKQAEPLYQSIRATLDHAHTAGLPASDTAAAERHLKDIAPQLKELQRWRRWGADTHRQALCEEIERLAADTKHDLEPLAHRLAELQDDWRGLDRNGAPADDALWQRFRAAAETIRNRCKPFYDAQTKLQAANREQREALCRQLEAFLDQVDWARMDWKKAMRAAREMRQAWAALEPAPAAAPGARRRDQRRPLEGRFRKSLRRLEEALDAERERNLAERRELIAQMQRLVDEPDLRAAMESAKALQRQWRPTVTGRKRDENALWQEFRAAADAVFARREAEQRARNAEQDEYLADREAICAALEQATARATDADALRKALREQAQQWQSTEGLRVPKAKIQTLSRRWQQAQDAAHAKLEALTAAARWAQLEALGRRAAWCDETARALVDGTVQALDAAALAAAWEALPAAADTETAQALEDAAALVLAAAGGDADALERLRTHMADAVEARRELCLRLEIAAGVDSPPELEAERMARQVQRLKARLSAGSETADDDADPLALLLRWYAAAPAAEAPDLHARLKCITVALRPADAATA